MVVAVAVVVAVVGVGVDDHLQPRKSITRVMMNWNLQLRQQLLGHRQPGTLEGTTAPSVEGSHLNCHALEAGTNLPRLPALPASPSSPCPHLHAPNSRASPSTHLISYARAHGFSLCFCHMLRRSST